MLYLLHSLLGLHRYRMTPHWVAQGASIVQWVGLPRCSCGDVQPRGAVPADERMDKPCGSL